MTGTKVLACSIGAPNEETIQKDIAAYEAVYRSVSSKHFETVKDACKEIEESDYHIVHVLASLDANGCIGGIPANNILKSCATQAVLVVIFGLENPVERYIAASKPDHATHNFNLIMTIERRSTLFPEFLRRLFGRVAKGHTLPMAWVHFAPQTKHASEHDVLPGCIFHAGRGDAILLP